MIEVRNLTHRYGNSGGIDSIDFQVADGECVLLTGANGSGKTTLVRHLNGLLEPEEGEVRVNGTPVHENVVAARANVGMVFQNPRNGFVSATVGADVAFGPENLGLPREKVKTRVRDALAAVEMQDRSDERIDELSGGEQARVAIAGALAMRPDHLVLDEPFAGLDWPARNAVLERLEALHDDGTSLVVVTHDLRDIWNVADRVVMLNNGAVVASGPPDDVREVLPEYGVRVP